MGVIPCDKRNCENIMIEWAPTAESAMNASMSWSLPKPHSIREWMDTPGKRVDRDDPRDYDYYDKLFPY